jgi:hypothetical protein
MAFYEPRSPYEAAWQSWNYGGGRMRGEPMPRIEDYPETFGENQGPALKDPSVMTPQRLPPAPETFPLRPQCAPEPRFPMDERLPNGGYMGGAPETFPVKPQRAPEPRSPWDERLPDGGYMGGRTPPTEIPELSSTNTPPPYGGDLDPYGPSGSQNNGYGSFPKPRNAGMPTPGGMMNPMTLGQLNRRRPY